MVISAAGCPSENVLLRFALGGGDEPDLAWVERHLDTCEVCRRSLAAAATEEPGSAQPAERRPQREDAVGRYEIEELLGVGGMGLVYAAHDPSLSRRVAIKFPRNAADATSAARLKREAQVMAKLAHPNLVPVFDLGEWEGQLFLAMELVEGTTLDVWRRGAVTQAELERVFTEAARGLAAAHAQGIVHRDFKPANVLIGSDGRARVTDFGLARPDGLASATASSSDASATAAPLTREGTLLGTLPYMAPEQLEGKTADARSDQFAWCVAFAEAITGRRPFAGETVKELRQAIARGPNLDGVPTRVRRVLARGLSEESANRFESMEGVLLALRSNAGRLLLVPGGLLAVVALLVGMIGVTELLAPWRHETEAPPSRVDVRVGQTIGIDLPFSKLARLAVSDPTVADVVPAGPNRLSATGYKLGATTVEAWSTTNTRRTLYITVVPF